MKLKRTYPVTFVTSVRISAELMDHETVLRRSYRRHMKHLAQQNPLLRSTGGIHFGIDSERENPNAVLDQIGREDTIVEQPSTGVQPSSRMPSLKVRGMFLEFNL